MKPSRLLALALLASPVMLGACMTKWVKNVPARSAEGPAAEPAATPAAKPGAGPSAGSDGGRVLSAPVGQARLQLLGTLVAARRPGPGFRLESLTEGEAVLSPDGLKDENGVPYEFEALTERDAARRGVDFVLRGAGPDGEMGTLDDVEWTPVPRKVKSKILQSMEPDEEMPD